jgi:hypothetical protein
MNLKSLVVDSKSAWASYPGYPDFEIEIVNLSRKELQNLRKGCVTQKYSRKTRVTEEVLDEEKFVKQFTAKTVKNWRGLTFEILETLLLIDTGSNSLDTEVPFSAENAQVLVTQSSEFDTWLNEVVFDLDNFRSKPTRGVVAPSD